MDVLRSVVSLIAHVNTRNIATTKLVQLDESASNSLGSEMETLPIRRPHKKPTVLWVTNLAAPYRVPVWQQLAQQYELHVALLESNAGLERDVAANRGRDWLHHEVDEIAFEELPSWKFCHGEARYYVLKRLRSLLLGRKYDVVVFGGWESPAYWSLLASSLLFGAARVGFYESPSNTMTHKSGIIAWMRCRFFRFMNAVVVPGEAAAEAVIAMGVPRNRVVQGFNAVDVSKFYEAGVIAAESDPKIPAAGHRYLYVGRLIPLKRVDEIIKAFACVAEQGDVLTVVGAGPLRTELRALADSIRAKVQFLESLDYGQVPAVMAQNQTLILASDREVWGLVVNEALASGMHVVVTHNCGVVASVRHMSGVYVARTDLTDLGQQMLASKSHWKGRIASPAILQHTPEQFARVFGLAVGASLGPRVNAATASGKEIGR